MSKIEVDLQNLSTLDAEIKLKENRKIALDAELESKARELIALSDRASKEIAQAKQQCEAECQGMKSQANAILKEAQEKLNLAGQRAEESKIIEEQIARIEVQGKAVVEAQKSSDKIMALALEKEHKANLLIEQYTKKLEELGEKPKEIKQEEKPKEEAKKKK